MTMMIAPYLRLEDGSMQPAGVDFRVNEDGEITSLSVVNHSSRHLAVREIVLMETGLPAHGIGAHTRFYAEGYQMLTQYAGTIGEPKVIGSYGTDWDFFRFPRYAGHYGRWTAYNLMCLWPDDGSVLLLAFASCHRFSGEFRFGPGHLEMVLNTEGLVLKRGDSWTLEEVFIAKGDSREELLGRLAQRLNHNHPPMRWHEIPTGWCSYYCLRPTTADGLVDSARHMARRIPELKRIQIDGGNSIANGDWLIPNPKLGSDIGTICKRIRAEGVEAAGYLSPFIISSESALYREHPDWLVQDAQGRPYSGSGRGKWYMLDGSHPQARAHVADVVRIMHDEWGIRYFKLDFLAYGAFPGGLRYDSSATMVQSYRLLLGAIVDAVGQDSFILACNAPFWPTLGLCHGNRVTNDISRDWKHIGTNASELFWRNWQHLVLWINDPDVLVLEKQALLGKLPDGTIGPRPSQMTDEEIAFHKAFLLASGGMVLSGDLLDGLSEANLDVIRRLIDNRGEAAVFDDETFQVGRLERGGEQILTLFNWQDTAQDVKAKVPYACRVLDFWTGEALFAAQPDTEACIVLRAHEGRVLRLVH